MHRPQTIFLASSFLFLPQMETLHPGSTEIESRNLPRAFLTRCEPASASPCPPTFSEILIFGRSRYFNLHAASPQCFARLPHPLGTEALRSGRGRWSRPLLLLDKQQLLVLDLPRPRRREVRVDLRDGRGGRLRLPPLQRAIAHDDCLDTRFGNFAWRASSNWMARNIRNRAAGSRNIDTRTKRTNWRFTTPKITSRFRPGESLPKFYVTTCHN